MRTYVIGVDPGLDGATVAIDTERSCNFVYFVHSGIKRNVSYLDGDDYLAAARKMIMRASQNMGVRPGHGIHNSVMIEAAAVMGRQSGQRTVGVNWGIIKACWDVLQFDVVIIPANVWKPKMVGVELSKSDGKQASCIVAARMGYEVPTHRPNGAILHDGVADAILIAEYGFSLEKK